MKNKDKLGGSTRCLITRRAISSQPLKSGSHVCRSLGLQSQGQLFPVEIFSTPGVQDLGSCLSVAHLMKWCMSVDLVWGYLMGSSLLVVIETEEQAGGRLRLIDSPPTTGDLICTGHLPGWNLKSGGLERMGHLWGTEGLRRKGAGDPSSLVGSDLCGWGHTVFFPK